MANGLNGVPKAWWEALVKGGPWAVWAGILLFLLWLTVIRPSAEDRKATLKDRELLMDTVTSTMRLNSSSMDKMSRAIESLRDTFKMIEDKEEKSTAMLREFTQEVRTFTLGVNESHKIQTQILERIEKHTRQ